MPIPLLPRLLPRLLPLLLRPLLAALLGVVALPLWAQAPAPWPAPGKTIKLVAPFAAGSGTDVMARLLADELQKSLAVSVIVDNKPGANGAVAAEWVKKAAPDGYTLFMATSSPLSAAPWLVKKPGYDPLRDYTPITRTTNFPFYLVVAAQSPLATLEQFVHHARQSGKLTMGYGNATGQVAGAHLMQAAGFSAVPVPYRSTPPAMVDLIGGQFDFMFVDLASSAALAKEGKLRPLALMADKRSSLAPGLPALGEKFPGFAYLAWGGLVGPAGLPPEIVARLDADTRAALARPALRERFASLGLEPIPSQSPEEFARFIKAQLAAWGERIQAAGMHAE